MNAEFAYVVAVRGIISLVFLAAGITAMVIGARFYRTGIGIAKDGSTLEFSRRGNSAKLKMQTVGGALMLTSVIWGLFAYLSIGEANYTRSGGPQAASTPQESTDLTLEDNYYEHVAAEPASPEAVPSE